MDGRLSAARVQLDPNSPSLQPLSQAQLVPSLYSTLPIEQSWATPNVFNQENLVGHSHPSSPLHRFGPTTQAVGELGWNFSANGSVVPTSAVQVGQTSLHSRQQPRKRKRETKEKQRKAARQPPGTTIEQRDPRCLECRLHSSHTGCFNQPICDRCASKYGKYLSAERQLETTFLDWRRLLQICQRLSAASEKAPLIVAAHHCQLAEPFILEFTFADKSKQDKLHRHIVVFRPHEQNLQFHLGTNPDETEPRAPAFDIKQLDDLIRTQLWSSELSKYDGMDLTSEEASFWEMIRLFIGYFAMTRNLSSTYVQALDLASTNMLGRTIAELIYAFGYRLQMLYTAIVHFTLLRPPAFEETSNLPAVTLYGLEVLYRSICSMRDKEWYAIDLPPGHALSSLKAYFTERVESIVSRLALLQCSISGRITGNRQMRPTPSMVEFARSLPKTGLPMHCIVTVSRFRRIDSISAPIVVSPSWEPGDKYRSTEVFSFQDDDILANLSLQDTSATCAREELIDDDNKVMRFTPLLPLSSIPLSASRADCTNTEEGTEMADFNTTGMASRLHTTQQEVDAMELDLAGNLPTPASPDMDGVAADESTPPSLVSGTPFSIGSPPTPISITTMIPLED